jgi:hypothetical protein
MSDMPAYRAKLCSKVPPRMMLGCTLVFKSGKASGLTLTQRRRNCLGGAGRLPSRPTNFSWYQFAAAPTHPRKTAMIAHCETAIFNRAGIAFLTAACLTFLPAAHAQGQSDLDRCTGKDVTPDPRR